MLKCPVPQIPTINLSSRPERSGVEGPCVFNCPVLLTLDFPNAIYFWDTTLALKLSTYAF